MQINKNNYAEYFMLYADNELSVNDREAVDQFVRQYPEMRLELDMLLALKVVPDENIVFENKEILYRTETVKKLVPFIWWVRIAAAAVVVIALGTVGWLYQSELKDKGSDLSTVQPGLTPTADSNRSPATERPLSDKSPEPANGERLSDKGDGRLTDNGDERLADNGHELLPDDPDGQVPDDGNGRPVDDGATPVRASRTGRDEASSQGQRAAPGHAIPPTSDQALSKTNQPGHREPAVTRAQEPLVHTPIDEKPVQALAKNQDEQISIDVEPPEPTLVRHDDADNGGVDEFRAIYTAANQFEESADNSLLFANTKITNKRKFREVIRKASRYIDVVTNFQ